MAELPMGTVTFLFSDIEGSTRLLEARPAEYAGILERQRAIVRSAIAAHGGVEVDTQGDSFFVAFPGAANAIGAAIEVQRGIGTEPWPSGADVRVRIGLHTGEGRSGGGGYVGLDVHRAARVMAAAHGGQVLVSDATRSLVARDLDERVGLRDLGEHRLRDLSAPVRLYQVTAEGLEEAFPPPRTLDAAPNNLPIQLTSFLGREREIDEITQRLGMARLLTLTGPGGTGKTRLALQVAARVVDRYKDGVFFVPLAPISEPALVPATVAQHLGLPQRGGPEPMRALHDHLQTRECLVVIDNFEQVLPAAHVVSELLGNAPQLRVLVTSRATIHVYGEQEYPVPPLGLPDPRRMPAHASGLTDYESVTLFMERATAVKPDFTITDGNAATIAEICLRLDGLPLAIELAAARVRVLTPQAIIERLGRSLDLLGGGARDLPDRQRTLRGAIGWSYDMLEEADRALFAGLAVFVGGASFAAIEAICGELLQADLLDTLTSLTENSLIRQSEGVDGEPRFTMLETIRDFALERSLEGGRHQDLQLRHATWFAEVAETAQPMLMSGERRAWLDRVDQDHDNIRAALAWTLERGEVELGLRLVSAAWRFWQMRGYLIEAQERIEAVLALEGVAGHPAQLYLALDALGGVAYWRGRPSDARSAYARALDLARQRGDRTGEAEQLYNVSVTYYVAVEADRGPGDLDLARDYAEEAREIYRQTGDRSGEGKAAWQMANIELWDNNASASRQRAEEALAIFTELDDQFMRAWSLWGVGNAAFREGRLADAADQFIRAMTLFEEANDISGYVLILTALSAVADKHGDHMRAARLSGAAMALARASGTGIAPRVFENMRFDPGPLQTDPETAAAWAEGEAWTVEEARAAALAPLPDT